MGKLTLAVLILLTLSSVVQAGIEMGSVSSSRLVSSENNKGYSDIISPPADDFDVFDERAIVCWDNTGVGAASPSWAKEYECGDYYATAHQDSTISSYGIITRGSAEEWNPFYHNLVDDFTQSSSSNFNIDFEIETPSVFMLTGTLNVWGDYGGTESGQYYAEVGLLSQNSEIFSTSRDSIRDYDILLDGPIQINETFVLDVGTYTLFANASSEGLYGPYWPNGYDGECWGIGGGGFANFDIEFMTAPQVVPEPASLLLLGLGLVMARKKR